MDEQRGLHILEVRSYGDAILKHLVQAVDQDDTLYDQGARVNHV